MAEFNSRQMLQQQFMKQAQPLEQGFQAERSSTILATLAHFKAKSLDKLPPEAQMGLAAKLMQVKQNWTGKKNALMAEYQPTIDAMNEIDKMHSAGGLAVDPEDLKARMVLPRDVADAVRPKPVDPHARGGKLRTERTRLENSLKEFQVELPREAGAFKEHWWKRGTPAGVADEVSVSTGKIRGYDDKGNPQYEYRAADQGELRRWATLTERLRQVKEQEADVSKQMLGASRLQRSGLGMRGRQPGSFASRQYRRSHRRQENSVHRNRPRKRPNLCTLVTKRQVSA